MVVMCGGGYPVFVVIVRDVDLCGVCVDWRLAEGATSSRRPQVRQPRRCDVVLWRGQISPAGILGSFCHGGRAMFLPCRAANAAFSSHGDCLRSFEYRDYPNVCWWWTGEVHSVETVVRSVCLCVRAAAWYSLRPAQSVTVCSLYP